MAKSFQLFLLALVLFFGASQRVEAVDPDDLEALQAFQRGLTSNGTWEWDGIEDPCGNHGITCEESKGKILKIDLPDNGLQGTIATELGFLSSLDRIRINGNPLSGTIPTELGKLSKLIRLSLHNTDLDGTLPTELGGLSTLSDLELSDCDFSGTLPTELGNLPLLRRLDLSNNDLSGTIPTELGLLTKVYYLQLRENSLNGTIPAELANLSGMVTLDFYYNRLTGTIPAFLDTFSSLSALYLSNNLLCYWTNYTGWATQTDSGENPACANCDPIPCQNGGVCTQGSPTYVCDCPPAFSFMPNCAAGFVGCAAGNYDHASWPSTTYGSTATGSCLRGFGSASAPTRKCLASSESWSSTIKNRCLALKCTSEGEWPMTIAGRRSTRPCPGGEIHRWCGFDGGWIDPPVYHCE